MGARIPRSYNGYRFTKSANELVYNPTNALSAIVGRW